MRTDFFYVLFCVKKHIGTQGEVCRLLKIFLNLSVVYATDSSKAMVPVLFLFCVTLWFILRSASCSSKSLPMLFVLVIRHFF